MNAPINDGGLAFPKDQERGTHGDVIEHAWPGMSLRDYFAAQVMPLVMSRSTGRSDASAKQAYEMADAMLKARTS